MTAVLRALTAALLFTPMALLSAEAPRLVSLAPHITELVYAAGAGSQLAGVVAYSDYPPAARNLPRVGDAFRLDYEAVALAQPDIVFAWGSGNPREMTERLQALGYQVVILEPRELNDIPEHIELIGALANTTVAASTAAEEFRRGLAELRAANTGKSALRVFLQFSAQPYFTVNGAHIASEALSLCGGRNIFADLPALAPTVGLESILRADPDAILATDSGEGWKSNWQNWGSLTAVRSGALYTVNRDHVSRAGPRLLDGARELCARLDDARATRLATD